MRPNRHRPRTALPSGRVARLALPCLFGALLLGCGGPEPGATTAFVPPATLPADDGWLAYVEPATIDRESARGLRPGASSPEAAVTHFYASRLRGDRAYEEVLVDPRPRRLSSALDELDEWKFHQFRLVRRKATRPDSLWVEVWFEIEVNGRRDDGSDEVTVKQVGDKWLIEEVPS